MSLRLKTILGVGLIEAISLAILITSVLNYMRLNSEQNLEDYVATTSALFATTTKDAVLTFDLASLDNFVDEILKNQGVLYARIKDNNDNLLASGGHEDLATAPFTLDNNYRAVDDGIYDVEQLITVGDSTYGRIEMGFTTSTIEESVNETRRLAATIALMEMLLVAMFSFCLGVYLTKQLKVLHDSTRRIAEGDLTQKIDIKAKDEIGEVADSFNTMITSLIEANNKTKLYQNELESLNKSLEERVEKRTQKILEQKDKLQDAYGQLQSAQDQLVQSEKMASLGQLAAGVAHEINNPVGFIKSNLSSLTDHIKSYQALIEKQQALLDKLEVDDSFNDKDQFIHIKEQFSQIKEYRASEDIDFINEDILSLVTESIDGTDRVAEIVKGLKVYSHASEDEMSECDINQSLENTLKMLNNELKYGCDVITELKELPLCICNPGKITQVFTNLIVNAIHAMDGKGTLTIATSHDTTVSPDTIVICVLDSGKGIEKENLPKLFDPFFTTKAVGEGTGLGLSISHGIISDHSGTMEVESEVGKGTLFTITLPVVQPTEL